MVPKDVVEVKQILSTMDEAWGIAAIKLRAYITAQDAEIERLQSGLATHVDRVCELTERNAAMVAKLRELGDSWDDDDRGISCRDQMQAMLSAEPAELMLVPDGWQLVPTNATDAMINAASSEWKYQNPFRMWDALLAATKGEK